MWIFFWLQTQSLNSVPDSQSANKNSVYRASAIGLTLWKKWCNTWKLPQTYSIHEGGERETVRQSLFPPGYWFMPLSLCLLPTSPSSWTFLRLVIFTEPSLKQPVACKNVLWLRMMGETDTEGLENQSGGWVRGSGKGHNTKKKSPHIILCCSPPQYFHSNSIYHCLCISVWSPPWLCLNFTHAITHILECAL